MHLTFGHKARFIAPVMTTSKMTTFWNVIGPKELMYCLKHQMDLCGISFLGISSEDPSIRKICIKMHGFHHLVAQ